MFCTNCGKELVNGSTFCPKCGATQQEPTPPSVSNTGKRANAVNQTVVQKAPYNTMCIIGLVISGISLLINFWGLVGIAGIIVSVIGLIGCKQRNEHGKTLAIVGIIVGTVSVIYAMLLLSIL